MRNWSLELRGYSHLRVLMVVMLSLLAAPSADGASAGGAAIAGSMSYGAPGIPGFNSPGPPKCGQAVVFDASVAALVVDVKIGRYSGPATISNAPDRLIADGEPQAENRSTCESWVTGGGKLSLDVRGVNQTTGAEVACDNLDGTWIRVATKIMLGLNGRCEIGGVLTQHRIALQGELAHVPDGLYIGPGYSTPWTTSAAIGGTLAVIPDNG